jgi:hypothetical protein
MLREEAAYLSLSAVASALRRLERIGWEFRDKAKQTEGAAIHSIDTEVVSATATILRASANWRAERARHRWKITAEQMRHAVRYVKHAKQQRLEATSFTTGKNSSASTTKTCHAQHR